MPYQQIFNQTHEFAGLLDLDGTLQYVNDSLLEFDDEAPEDVVGKKFWEMDWLNWSERVQQQVRGDIQRAANGEFVRHKLEAKGEDRSAIIDFSISSYTTESGDKQWLLAEGRDITQVKHFEGVSSRVPLELLKNDLLVAFSRDSDEVMSQSIIDAFLALDIDIFERETTLHDWINTDALDGLAWSSERPITHVTRIWGYKVALSDEVVRIYADS